MSYVDVCMNNQGTTSPLKIGLDKVTHCVGHILANTRPHHLHWGDQEMGTVISCTECSLILSMRLAQNAARWVKTREGGSGNMLPQEILRLLLSPFCDRSKVVIATWFTEYCIQFLAVHVCIC